MKKYYLGGDVSKGYCDFVILDENKEIVEPNFQLDDTREGHGKLRQVISEFFSSHPDSILHAATESTGSYENNWIKCMLDCSDIYPIKVARLNPLGVTRNSQADMKRNRTDKISAKDVAEYLIAHPQQVKYIEQISEESLKEQYNYIQMMIKQKVQLNNLLEKDVYKANPELLIYCKNGCPRWLLKLLQQYPTAKQLAEASPESILEISYIKNKTKACKIIDKAKTSVASYTDQITARRISDLANEILAKEQKIDYEKKQLEKNKKLLPKNVQLLTSFRGIGVYSAVGLLIHIDNIERFNRCKSIACYYGLHPVYRKSGDGTYVMRMSKKGAAAVRQILFMVTKSAIVYNPHIKEIYERHLQRGKCKLSAMGVCMHKILRIVYGMLKNQTEYDMDIDRRNQNKQYKVTQSTTAKKDRRYQQFDKNAPVSRRQTKKRNEQQDINNINNINVKNLRTYKTDLSDIYRN